MPIFRTCDGTELYFKDWGAGQPIVFVGGWLLSSDMWEYQMNFLASHGFRVIAYDRRGFGRSSQPWSSYDYETLTNDLSELIVSLDLTDAILVGYSMGGGEVVRYLGKFGAGRVSRLVLLSSTTPFLLAGADNPSGMPLEVFDGLRQDIMRDRFGFLERFGRLYTGADRENSAVTQAMLDWTFGMGVQASIKATYDCVATFSETDLRADMKEITVPTLIIHGDADPVVPAALSGAASAAMIQNAEYIVYEGASHATYLTHKERLCKDLLNFATS